MVHRDLSLSKGGKGVVVNERFESNPTVRVSKQGIKAFVVLSLALICATTGALVYKSTSATLALGACMAIWAEIVLALILIWRKNIQWGVHAGSATESEETLLFCGEAAQAEFIEEEFLTSDEEVEEFLDENPDCVVIGHRKTRICGHGVDTENDYKVVRVAPV